MKSLSHVRLFATPWTMAYQAPLSMGFSRQEYWKEREVTQSCPTLSDAMDCSPPGSSVHGTFQARVLQWGAVAFSACTEESSIIVSECVKTDANRLVREKVIPI